MENNSVVVFPANQFRKDLKGDMKEVFQELMKEYEKSKKIPPLYSRKELCRLTGKTEQTIINWEKKNMIQSVDVGNRKMYRPEEVQRFLDTK